MRSDSLPRTCLRLSEGLLLPCLPAAKSEEKWVYVPLSKQNSDGAHRQAVVRPPPLLFPAGLI